MTRVLTRSFILGVAVLIGFGGFTGASVAETGRNNNNSARPERHERFLSERAGDAARVIGVLESRIGTHRLSKQAREKLAVMDAEKLKLVTALCDRIAASGDKPSSDVALLLAATFIVLS